MLMQTATGYATGGNAIINEKNGEKPLRKWSPSPNWARKVMTANATAGLVEQAVQSVMRDLEGSKINKRQDR